MYNIIYGKNLHNAVEEAMRMVNRIGIVVDGENQSRDDKLKELSVAINVEDIREITISKAMPGDLYSLVEYELEFVEGVRDFEKSWDYTYHQLFGKYISQCINELRRNKGSRRAVLPICGEKSYGTQYPPCLQVIIFNAARGKLNTTAVFRSNDCVKAFPMNAFALCRLAHRIAEEIGVEVGGYTHIAESFHAYQRDWEQLDAYCNLFRKRPDEDLFYSMEEYTEIYNTYAKEYREKCLERKMMIQQQTN